MLIKMLLFSNLNKYKKEKLHMEKRYCYGFHFALFRSWF